MAHGKDPPPRNAALNQRLMLYCIRPKTIAFTPLVELPCCCSSVSRWPGGRGVVIVKVSAVCLSGMHAHVHRLYDNANKIVRIRRLRSWPLTGRHRRHSLGLYLQGNFSNLANNCRAAEVDFNRKELKCYGPVALWFSSSAGEAGRLVPSIEPNPPSTWQESAPLALSQPVCRQSSVLHASRATCTSCTPHYNSDR